MTAHELILQLQQLPPGTPVVVRGYGDGYNPALRLVPRTLMPHPGSRHDWNGQLTDAEAGHDGAFDAVEIFGENKGDEGQ
jgi:hypothetical protein